MMVLLLAQIFLFDNKGMYPDEVCETRFKRWGNANRQVQKSTKYKDVKIKAKMLYSMRGNVRRTFTIDRLVSLLIIESTIYCLPLFYDTPGCVIPTKKAMVDLVDMLPEQVVLYTCQLCNQFFSGRCVKTAYVPREQYFCLSRLSEAFTNLLSAAIECPVGKESVSFCDVQAPGWMFRQQLSFLNFHYNLCRPTGTVGAFQDHCCSPCETPRPV